MKRYPCGCDATRTCAVEIEMQKNKEHALVKGEKRTRVQICFFSLFFFSFLRFLTGKL